MSKYDIKNTNNLFDNFYKKTYETDMSILIDNLLSYYNDRICVLKPQLFDLLI